MEVGKTYHIVGHNNKLRHDGRREFWDVVATYTGTEGDGDNLFIIHGNVPYLLPSGYLENSVVTPIEDNDLTKLTMGNLRAEDSGFNFCRLPRLLPSEPNRPTLNWLTAVFCSCLPSGRCSRPL